MDPLGPEKFVDADEAGKFLSLTRRHILELTRAGKLPGHPIGGGARRVWRFRLSELAAAVARNVFTSPDDPAIRNPQLPCRGLQETSKW
jgi:excisionase family DNA binding protein